MTCRIRCNMSERVRMWPPKPQRLVFQLKMLGGSLSPDSSLSALEMLIQILPSVEKPASNICENIWKTAESASSKCTAFRSRNMGFGMCKTNKQTKTDKRTFKWLWNTSTRSFLGENLGGFSLFLQSTSRKSSNSFVRLIETCAAVLVRGHTASCPGNQQRWDNPSLCSQTKHSLRFA